MSPGACAGGAALLCGASEFARKIANFPLTNPIGRHREVLPDRVFLSPYGSQQRQGFRALWPGLKQRVCGFVGPAAPRPIADSSIAVTAEGFWPGHNPASRGAAAERPDPFRFGPFNSMRVLLKNRVEARSAVDVQWPSPATRLASGAKTSATQPTSSALL